MKEKKIKATIILKNTRKYFNNCMLLLLQSPKCTKKALIAQQYFQNYKDAINLPF